MGSRVRTAGRRAWRIAAAIVAGGSQPVFSQAISSQDASIVSPNEVLSRPRPAYAPTGVKVGGFTALPSLGIKLDYDDNVFGSDRLVVRDEILTVEPQLLLTSDWSRHQLTLQARGVFQRFAKTGNQNNEQVDLRANGRLDIRHDASLTAQARYGRLIEPRGSIGDTFVGGTPVIYQLTSGDAEARWDPGAFRFRVKGGVATYSYDPVRLNGARISQAYRDRQEVNGEIKLGYELGPAITGFVSASLNDVNYDNRNSGSNLDSHGFTILGGVDFAITRLVVGSVGVGYLSQNFADPRLSDVGGLGFNGRVYWNPTPLLSLTLRAGKSISQAGIIGVAGVIQRDLSVAADYELLRNLLIHADAQSLRSRFRGADRTDNVVLANISATYLMNRNVDLGVSYQRQDQSSSGRLGRAFTANRVELSLTLMR